METFKKLLFLITAQERKRGVLLLIMILIMALLDMIGVASILPFTTVLVNPTLIETNTILIKMFQISTNFGVENNQQFLAALGILVFVLLTTSLAFKALTTYAQIRFIHMRGYSIGKRLFEGYIKQPYSWFLDNHSSELGKNILSEISQVVGGGINPLIELIAKGAVAITIITLLIITDPKLALIVGFTLSAAYGLLYYFIRNFLTKIGKERMKSNKLRFGIVSEAFGATKEVKVGGLEQVYINRFSDSAFTYARATSFSHFISNLPRFALEAVAFGGILLIMIFMIMKTGSFNNALPIVSLYIFAAYRLMPALQKIYSSFTQLTFIGPVLNSLTDDIKSLKSQNINHNNVNLSLNRKIFLKNIYYNYPNSSRTALENIDIVIPAKNTVGFVGPTGSGKTTTVDIILGLLEAKKGTLEIDGQSITKENTRAWQRSIGYVPQNIYLSDDTIAANIALGVDTKDINHEIVEKVSKIANLHEFVVNELPEKYLTSIGERGVRLSGGQGQRIAIARALYHNPQILILDEATSALDNQTEQVVMDAVNKLNKEMTIIIIAHRLNTVKNCDIIFKFDKGKIIGQGTFNELTLK
jgi:ABC-type multidrug transport system fused ATPase/permease subunit